MGLEIIDNSYTAYSRTLFDLVTQVLVHLDRLSSNIVYINYLLAFKFSQDKTCCQEQECSQIYSISLSLQSRVAQTDRRGIHTQRMAATTGAKDGHMFLAAMQVPIRYKVTKSSNNHCLTHGSLLLSNAQELRNYSVT